MRLTRPRASRTIAGLWVVCVSLILVVIGATALDIGAQRQATIADQRRNLEQLGRVLAEDMSRYARVVDVVLRDVQTHISDMNVSTPDQFRSALSDVSIYALLRARAQEMPESSALVLVDSAGKIVNLSRVWPPPNVDVSDRDYFRYLSAHDGSAPYVTEVRRGRVSDTPMLFLARRIDGPQGEFLGVIAGVLDVAYLTGRYQAILSRIGESITLLQQNGDVLARYPGLGATASGRMPAESPWYAVVAAGGGTYLSPGYLASRASIVAATPVPDYGLVVDVVVSAKLALAAWRRQAIVTAAAAAAISVGIVVLFAVIARQFRRLQRVTEDLRASERRTRDYARTASEWFWEQDANLRFTWISQESPIHDPFDESYVGQTRWDLIGAIPTEPHWAAHRADLEARRPFRDFVYQRVGNDGRLHHVSISGTPVLDDDGQFRGYRGTGRDISAVVEAAAELRRARDLAEAGSRVKSEFLASMTHELRTPLNAIIGFAELIRDQPFGPVGGQYVDYAKEIHASGHHLLAVINDVLDMSKIEAGRYALSDEAIDLGDKVATCYAILAPRAGESQVRLLRELPLDGIVVRADRRAMRQVLLNVLANAVKFTPAGGSVTVSAEITGGGDVVLVVTDTGIGIDKTAMRHLFEPFQQADSSMTRRFGGTGLGLSISRRLMMLHDGTLELESAPGKGTIVRIRFPHGRVTAVPSAGAAGAMR
ncbi:MAG TPA: ATP-binding protein [Acetobacteraceae bacterium]|jgi:signal transduction histidine kinase|nr:ATP-binding protein [Acetobacteraceae bacterium]